MAFQDFYTTSGAPAVNGSSMGGTPGAMLSGNYATSVSGGASAAAAGGAVVMAIVVLVGAFLLLHTR
jgi:hypothetical protein